MPDACLNSGSIAVIGFFVMATVIAFGFVVSMWRG